MLQIFYDFVVLILAPGRLRRRIGEASLRYIVNSNSALGCSLEYRFLETHSKMDELSNYRRKLNSKL